MGEARGSGQVMTLAGQYAELLSLSARIDAGAVTVRATLVDGDGKVSGGVYPSLAAVDVSLLVESYDDLEDSKSTMKFSISDVAKASNASSTQSLPSAAALTWQQVAKASEDKEKARALEPADPEHDGVLATGEWIDHPTFGRCRIERVEEDDDFISVRLKSQRLVRLSMEVLKVIPAGEFEGRRLFRVIPPR